MFRSGNTISVIAQNIIGAPKYTIWLFPLISLIFFLLPYSSLFQRLPLLTELLKSASFAYTAILAPGYDTYKAIEHRSNPSPEKMLSYWIVLAIWFVLSKLLEVIYEVDMIELVFYLIVMGITIMNYEISELIYKRTIKPLIDSMRRNTANS